MRTPLLPARKPVHPKPLERAWRAFLAPPAPKPANDLTEQLVKAAERGQWQEVERLLDLGADPNQVAANGKLALNEAVFARHYVCAQILADNGADPRGVDQRGHSALGALWRLEQGGEEDQESALSRGQARVLLARWQARYPTERAHHFFAAQHQDLESQEPLSDRFAIKAPWLGFGSSAGPTAMESPLEEAEIDSWDGLRERQQARRARLSPLPGRLAPGPQAESHQMRAFA